jgi:hypothetical protein
MFLFKINRAGIAQSGQRLTTGWTAKVSEFEFRWGKNFYFSMSSTQSLGSAQPPIQWIPGVLSPGIKRLECEANTHLLRCRSKKNVGLYIQSLIRLHGVVLN